MVIENKETYQQAHELKGLESQVTVAIEELSEEIHALSKFKRLGEGLLEKENTIRNLINEAADVIIMMEQLVISFDKEDLFEEIKLYKIDRLKERLKNIKGVKENGKKD